MCVDVALVTCPQTGIELTLVITVTLKFDFSINYDDPEEEEKHST